jgi:curved DNA-binding protein CbpA
MEIKPDPRRKHPRLKAPQNLHVGWKSPGHHAVSRAETIALGGLFLYTPNPPAVGSMVQLIFDLPTGEVRARAVVRHSTLGKGMGVQFVQMASEDRGRLNRFLVKHVPKSDPKAEPTLPSNPVVAPSPEQTAQNAFEAEVTKLLAVAKKGTHYQLLEVTPDTSASQIKQKFYALAQKFHPDHHMERKESLGLLKELMGAVTTAYKTLTDDEKRRLYDKQLESSGVFDLHRNKTEAQTIIEESMSRAKECLRAGNFAGSIVWLRKCVELAPNDAAHHAMLARSLGKVAQYRGEATVHFQKAIELDPWNTDPYLHLAELYEDMKLPLRAQAIYSKVLEINPVHSEARARHSKISPLPTV